MTKPTTWVLGCGAVALIAALVWRGTPSQETVSELTEGMTTAEPVAVASTFSAANEMMESLMVITYGELFHTVTLFYATNRTPSGVSNPATPADQFTARVGPLSYGTAEVSIPVNHQVGHLESQGALASFFVDPSPLRHVILQSLTPKTEPEILANIATVLEGDEKSTLFYIHGFNVGVDTAARRSGQLTYDLDWTGPSFFFSWPSGNSMDEYDEDQTKARASRVHLQQALETIAETDTDRIVIISHSMGTDLLTQALDFMGAANSPALAKIETVVLAAPDIDSVYFQSTIVPAIARIRNQHDKFNVTVYASEADSALWLSDVENGETRIGAMSNLTPQQIEDLRPVQMVDASLAKTNFFGHTYINDNPSVIGDVYCMLKYGPDPKIRATLEGRPDPRDGPSYRIIPKTVSADGPDDTLDNGQRRPHFVCEQEDQGDY